MWRAWLQALGLLLALFCLCFALFRPSFADAIRPLGSSNTSAISSVNIGTFKGLNVNFTQGVTQTGATFTLDLGSTLTFDTISSNPGQPVKFVAATGLVDVPAGSILEVNTIQEITGVGLRLQSPTAHVVQVTSGDTLRANTLSATDSTTVTIQARTLTSPGVQINAPNIALADVNGNNGSLLIPTQGKLTLDVPGNGIFQLQPNDSIAATLANITTLNTTSTITTNTTATNVWTNFIGRQKTSASGTAGLTLANTNGVTITNDAQTSCCSWTFVPGFTLNLNAPAGSPLFNINSGVRVVNTLEVDQTSTLIGNVFLTQVEGIPCGTGAIAVQTARLDVENASGKNISSFTPGSGKLTLDVPGTAGVLQLAGCDSIASNGSNNMLILNVTTTQVRNIIPAKTFCSVRIFNRALLSGMCITPGQTSIIRNFCNGCVEPETIAMTASGGFCDAIRLTSSDVEIDNVAGNAVNKFVPTLGQLKVTMTNGGVVQFQPCGANATTFASAVANITTVNTTTTIANTLKAASSNTTQTITATTGGGHQINAGAITLADSSAANPTVIYPAQGKLTLDVPGCGILQLQPNDSFASSGTSNLTSLNTTTTAANTIKAASSNTTITIAATTGGGVQASSSAIAFADSSAANASIIFPKQGQLTLDVPGCGVLQLQPNDSFASSGTSNLTSLNTTTTAANTINTATDVDMNINAGATNRNVNLTPTGSGQVQVASGKILAADTLQPRTGNTTLTEKSSGGSGQMQLKTDVLEITSSGSQQPVEIYPNLISNSVVVDIIGAGIFQLEPNDSFASSGNNNLTTLNVTTLQNFTSLKFADAAGDPATTRQVQFNGTDLKAFDGTVARKTNFDNWEGVQQSEQGGDTVTAQVETDFATTKNIAANHANVLGRVVKYFGAFRYTTTAAGGLTLHLKFKIGGVTINDPSTIAVRSGVTNQSIHFSGTCTTRSIGGSGTLIDGGSILCVDFSNFITARGGVSSAIDLGAAETAKFTAQWNAASQSVTMEEFMVEVCNW